MSVAAALVLAAALLGALLRPRDVHEWWFAAGGACLVLVLGLETPAAAARALDRDRAVFAFLGGVLLLATLADASGLFRLAAAAALRSAGARQARLFWAVAATSFAGTVLLSL